MTHLRVTLPVVCRKPQRGAIADLPGSIYPPVRARGTSQRRSQPSHRLTLTSIETSLRDSAGQALGPSSNLD